MPEIMMPRLSDTMEAGELARWLKKVGDEVHKGDVLAEIETDKATMDLESFEDGVLERVLVSEGDMVPIGQPVAIVGDGSGSEEPSAAPEKPAAAQESGPATQESGPAAQEAAPEAEKESAAAAQETAPSADAPAPAGDATRPRTSPLARKIAREHGIDLASIAGSGPQGRIVRADVEKAIAEGGAPAPAELHAPAGKPASGEVPAGPDVEEIPINNIRRTAARRLTDSQAVPHFALTAKAAVDRLIALRAEVNAALEEAGAKVSINDLVIRACAIVLAEHPEVNSSWGGDKLLRHRHVNVGFAVATDDGLMVPVIKEAETKSLTRIASDAVELAGRARNRKLTPDEFFGVTFTVSNLGMFGIEQFTAVINPPAAAILAVGAAVPEPAVRDGELVTENRMALTLTADHRVIDGAVGAAFLRDLKGILEQPLRIIL